MECGIKIHVETLEEPLEGWVSISAGSEYGYSNVVRGVFTEDDLDGQLVFIHSAVETVLNLERMKMEADEAEARALKSVSDDSPSGA